MKILIVGCSFSSGWGYEHQDNNPYIWPNLVGSYYGAKITNLSISGIDNTGIFLNTLSEISKNNYDKIIVQWTSLERVVVGPDLFPALIDLNHPCRHMFSDSDYQKFYKVFLLLNGSLNHWNRLFQMISYLQKIENLYFVNGLLSFNKELFNLTSNKDLIKNEFVNSWLPWPSMPDYLIDEICSNIIDQIRSINLKKWVNPYQSFKLLKLDNVSETDLHPGFESQKLYAKLIIDNILIDK